MNNVFYFGLNKNYDLNYLNKKDLSNYFYYDICKGIENGIK